MYKRLAPTCECGKAPARLREVGLTADHQLVLYWRCSHCRKHVYIVKALSDCWRDCPSSDWNPVQPAGAQAADSAFLRRVGIRPLDEES